MKTMMILALLGLGFLFTGCNSESFETRENETKVEEPAETENPLTMQQLLALSEREAEKRLFVTRSKIHALGTEKRTLESSILLLEAENKRAAALSALVRKGVVYGQLSGGQAVVFLLPPEPIQTDEGEYHHDASFLYPEEKDEVVKPVSLPMEIWSGDAEHKGGLPFRRMDRFLIQSTNGLFRVSGNLWAHAEVSENKVTAWEWYQPPEVTGQVTLAGGGNPWSLLVGRAALRQLGDTHPKYFHHLVEAQIVSNEEE